jgi:hypothetical protein
VNLEAQLLPNTFEHALNHLLNHEIGLRAFEAQIKNEDVGANDLLSSVPLRGGIPERDRMRSIKKEASPFSQVE